MNAVGYGNGISETWTHDNSYRPTNITDVLSGTTVQKLTYAYDNADNVKSITDTVNESNTQAFTYDPVDRLLTAASGTAGYGTFAWTYDKIGNRLTQVQGSTTSTYTYSTGSNRLATITITNATAQLQQLPNLRPQSRGGRALWARAFPGYKDRHDSAQLLESNRKSHKFSLPFSAGRCC